MRPILLELGSYRFSSYFVCVLFGYLLAVYLVTRAAHRQGLPVLPYFDLCLVAGVAGLVGARLMHVVVELPRFYLSHPMAILKFWYGGFVLYGGLLSGALAAYVFARFRALPWRQSLDLMVKPLLLAIAIGRLGCFLNGCCYGKITSCPWPISVIYQANGGVVPQASPLHTPLYATPIYDALLCLGLYFYLLYLDRSWRVQGNRIPPGRLAWYGVVGYALGRFMIEYLRADPERGFYGPQALSTAQLISLALLAVAGWLWWRERRQQS